MSNTTLAQHWNHLATIATLGVARQPLKEAWPELLRNAQSLPAGNDGTQLLRAAAATQLLMLAGQRHPKTDIATPTPAPTETATFLSEQACWRIAKILVGDMRPLVHEWCALVTQRQAIVLPQWLPSLLAVAKPDELKVLMPLMGKRATWLEHQGTAIAGENEGEEAAWQNGTLAERENLLSKLRRSDLDKSRALLQQTWETDSPEARAAFLKIVLENISIADEALLEKALDDKRKPVRLAAAECLSRIKESAHQQRMQERMNPLLRLNATKGGLLGMQRKMELTIDLPEKLAADAVRDGVEAKPPAHQKIGERSFWFAQLLAAVDPAHWSRQFQTTPDLILKAASASEHANTVIEGLSVAAIRHRDTEWATTLAEWWIEHSATSKVQTSMPLPSLLEAIDAGSRQQFVLSLMERTRRQPDLCHQILSSAEGNWTPQLTKAALDFLLDELKAEQRGYGFGRDRLFDWALRVDVDSAMRLHEKLLERCNDQSPWRASLQRFIDVVEFRHAMKMELLP